MSNVRSDYMSIRIDKVLKEDFYAFCKKCGMTVSGAVNYLIRRTIREEKLPFDVSVGKDDDVYGMDEGGDPQILRVSIRVDKEVRNEFAKICKNIGFPMGRIIKMFMKKCVNEGKFPF